MMCTKLSIILSPTLEPPVVVPLVPSQNVIANETETAVLSFRIDEAHPPVLTSDLRWFYTFSASQSNTPNFSSIDFLEITDLKNRTSQSELSYSNGNLILTISNIVQSLMVGDETDAGRYFLLASNPAGENSNYIDLTVFGKIENG